MKSILASLGGTRFEPTLLKIASTVLPLFQRVLNDQRPFWVREGVSESQKTALEPLRRALVESNHFFSVPSNSWLIEPVGVSSRTLETALRWAFDRDDLDVLTAVKGPNLSFDTDWTVAYSFSEKIIKQVKDGKLQLSFAPKGTLGTRRRLIPLEIWKHNTQGNLVSPAWNGTFTEVAADETGKADLAFAAACKSIHEVDLKIDAVYLWVDGSDPQWIAKKSRLQGDGPQDHGSAPSRFMSRNELYFSLRSLVQHAPWVNRIWVVTDEQTPELGELADRVTVIDHKDFIPSEYLPTFNSHTITANLHRIPGLTEHFLYLNDDIFFGRNLHPGIWFDTLGRSVIRYTRTLTPGFSAHGKDLIQVIRHNTVRLAHSRGLRVTTRSIQHGPHPMQKTIMEKLWKEFSVDFDTTCRNSFRSETDLVPEWIHNFAAISAGRGLVGGKLTYNYIAINAKSSLPRILALFFRRVPSVLCLNDVSELGSDEITSEDLVENRLRLLTKLLESDR